MIVDSYMAKIPGFKPSVIVHVGANAETALKRAALSPDELDVLVIDIQGAELLCFKGVGAYLDHVIFIEIEVSREEIYEGGVLFSEVDKFLRRGGFKRLSEIPWHGDSRLYPGSHFEQRSVYTSAPFKCRRASDIYLMDSESGPWDHEHSFSQKWISPTLAVEKPE
jgi:Methyltransferase FkbM domain